MPEDEGGLRGEEWWGTFIDLPKEAQQIEWKGLKEAPEAP